MENPFDDIGDSFEDRSATENDNERSVPVDAEPLSQAQTAAAASKKKRRLTSEVWKHFEILPPTEGEKKQRAKCMKCGLTYIADSSYGTGNIKRHIETCIRKDTRDLGQLLLSKSDGAIITRSAKFDEDKFRELLVMAIVMHDLPFQFVEYAGIRRVFSYICADLKLISRNTAKADVLSMYKREKDKLKKILGVIPGRICLTSDMWSSLTTDGYLCLTAHYVDANWELQKRILNFSFMPPPHSGVALSEKIYNLLCDWGIERKLFSITLDNASANDCFVDLLKRQLLLKDALLVNGNYFHIRCCAHILNLIVQDGMKEIDDVVIKIRESIKYVKGSQMRKQKFLDCATQVSLECKKSLRQDVPTRWNSTFLMLDGALYYQRAFLHLQLSDSNYKHPLSQDEWDKVEKLCKFLKVFYDVTCLFSGTQYPTSNLYFPQVFVVQDTLRKAKEDLDSFMRTMAIGMMSKFDKYWKDYSMILSIAVILDPRYKIQFVEFSYKRLYGPASREMANVRDKLFELFDLYMQKYSKPTGPTSSSSSSRYSNDIDMVSKECMDVMQEFDDFESEEFTFSAQKSQLQLYLDEPKVDRKIKLNVLDFWKANQFRYPELSIMARDILSIPISTVASKSAFSVGGRVLDQYRSALKPENVEAIICTRDWIFGSDDDLALAPKLEDLTEDISKLEISINNSQSVECSNTVPNDG